MNIKQTYFLPTQLEGTDKFYKTSDGSIIIKINEHKEELLKGNAALTENLFSFVLAGHKEILSPEGKIIINANYGCFLQKGNFVVSERFDDGTNYKGVLIFVNDELLFESLKTVHKTMDSINSPNNKINIACDQTMQLFLFMLCESLILYQNKIIDNILKVKIKELFVLLAQSNPHILSTLKNLADRKQKTVLNIFELHYKENLSLENYAHLTSKSISTLKRQFKNETNQTPFEWISNRRLDESKKLLLKMELNITDIAYDLGYESLSHFSRSFSEKFGKSPSQFRNELLSK